MPGYKGIIFDFNGVLWHDSLLQQQAWDRFACQLRGAALSPLEMDEHVHGRTNRDTLEYLVGHALSPAQQEQLSERKEAIYRALCLGQGPDFRLAPGAPALLDFLAQHGIPHAIATASAKPNVDFFVEHLALHRWFDPACIVYDDGTFPGKPAPDIYQIAARRLGLAPAECIVVEDARSGVRAAQAAGIGQIIALATGSTAAGLRSFPGVNGVILQLSELDRQFFEAGNEF